MNSHIKKVLCYGADKSLSLQERPVEPTRAGEVPIRVIAFGVNRADLLQRAGYYPAPPGVPADVLGLEFAGEVLADGDRWRVGDRVMGICGGGGYSDHINAHEGCLLPVPKDWSWEDAATFSEVYLTAFDALKQAQVQPGERVLIHAVGSGVGAAAAQIGAWMGAEVVGTTRTDWKRTRALEELPVSQVVLLTEGDFQPLEAIGLFDVVIDFVGAAYLKQNIKTLRNRGRLIIVGLLGGARGELPLGALLAQRLTIKGTVLRSRGLDEKMSLTHEVERLLLPAIERAQLKRMKASEVFAATPEGVEDAHQLLQRGAAWAKLACIW